MDYVSVQYGSCERGSPVVTPSQTSLLFKKKLLRILQTVVDTDSNFAFRNPAVKRKKQATKIMSHCKLHIKVMDYMRSVKTNKST